MKTLQKENINNVTFEALAQTLNVEPAAIHAVHQVESASGNGFLPDGRPLALFEGHIFWHQLKKQGINPEPLQSQHPDIIFPQLNVKTYKRGALEYDRINRACAIHRQAALLSTSWGAFQIMGFNHKLCGFDSVYTYVASMYQSQENQFRAFITFLQNTGLDIPLREKRWTDFARKYNGPKYKENKYDERLEKAYNQAKERNLTQKDAT